ncbi:hypothetical protein XPA_010714 [Xanthoria parietina]
MEAEGGQERKRPELKEMMARPLRRKLQAYLRLQIHQTVHRDLPTSAELYIIEGLTITTVAAPSASSPIITTNFDNLPQRDPVTDVLLPSPIGIQNGLLFAGFRVRSDGVSIARSVSPPDQAASNNLNRQLQGNPNPSITTVYTDSKVKSFTAISTFVSCVVTAEVQVGVPQSCDLEF